MKFKIRLLCLPVKLKTPRHFPEEQVMNKPEQNLPRSRTDNSRVVSCLLDVSSTTLNTQDSRCLSPRFYKYTHVKIFCVETPLQKWSAMNKAKESHKMRGAAMSLTVTASGFLIFLLPVPVIQGQDGWGVNYSSAEICGVKGSTVDLNCTCTYPSSINGVNTTVNETLWFIKGPDHDPQDLSTDPNYSGRVEYLSHDDNNYILRIRDLRESDSAEYKFRFITNQPDGRYTGSPGVTLRVTDFQVQVKVSSLYIWHNNGQKMDEETSSHPASVNDNGSYSCAFRRQGDYSPPEYMPKVPSVSFCPSGEIVNGSSVTLSCSSDANPAATYTWYKKNQHHRSLSREPQLVFRPIQLLDSGEYYCKVENKLGSRTSESISIDVKYAPRPPSVSMSPSGEIMEGRSVTLTCRSDANPAAKYTWYKEKQMLSEGPDGTYHFSSISSEDRGNYYCKSENKYGQINSSSVFIHVLYVPKLPSVSVSPSGEIMEGSSVNLTCSSDANPAANYTWYKENQTLIQGPGEKVHFFSISSKDSGIYHCMSENKYGLINSSSLVIDVQYAPKLPSVSVSPSGEIMEGSSVNLTCSSDANPAANYTWYKENLLQTPGGSYHFPSIGPEDGGHYHCKSENKYGQINSSSLFINVLYAPRLPIVSVSPSGKIMEGSTVNLTCSSDANPAANYTWFKENDDSPKASGQRFTITDITLEHSGNYYCKAQNRRGHYNTTLDLNVVAGAWKSIVAATVPAISLVILLTSVFLWITKKRGSKQTSEAGERPDDREQIQPAEQRVQIEYATVYFTNKQTDPIYSNIRPANARRYKDKNDEEEMVEYAGVAFNSASRSWRTRSLEATAEPTAVYSKINRFHKKHGQRNL
ncbi:B-cell receptor CD22-like isoform X2 [Acanthopagrus latus]|uniref:B-cell receptor CD22-like isoform X2 n=1 Tax=Acanthopagrus latus TaxID=8177 RepID=UPI00187C65C2|nr:B-cell receptor CD22-like isoform X2 [Acanthopagrus latus]